MRRGFTLIELMTVLAIMALLGMASMSGYNALQRGIRERGAVAAASALLRAAKERAAVDRVPTAVYCYNRMIRDADADSDENAVVVGVMTAVRRSGRLSMVRGNFLYDEFSDLNLTHVCYSDKIELTRDKERTYSVDDLDKRPAMKLYKFPTGNSMEYSLVADAVWCTDANKLFLFSGTPNSDGTNCVMSAFYLRSGSKHNASWKVGDAYAFEIGEVQLPEGIVFGESVPSDVGTISTPTVFVFDPESEQDESIEVNTVKPGADGKPKTFMKAGTATSDPDENV